MITELYEKMSDDERLQYIYELENMIEKLEQLKYVRTKIIRTQQELIECNKEEFDAFVSYHSADKRKSDYKQSLLDKYYISPIPCESTCYEKTEKA